MLSDSESSKVMLLIWGNVGDVREYGIALDLVPRIKKYLVDNAETAGNATGLAELCCEEFDLEYEENHPVYEWAMNVWNFIYGEEN